jgi:2-methylcitrate dehydratase PrpD
MAKQGMTGQRDVLEAPRGLMNMITAGKVEAPERILSDWGQPYRLFEIGIKSYPCCYHLQRIIEATLELRRERHLRPEDIECIEVEVNAFFPTVVQHLEPRDEIETQFSLPHAVSIAMLHDDVRPAGFARATIADERFRRFRQKVKQVVREDWGWTPTGWTPRITYTLTNGEVIVREPKTEKGQPPALIDFDACIPKYRSCVDNLFPEQNVRRSIEMVRNLAALSDSSALMAEVAAIRN